MARIALAFSAASIALLARTGVAFARCYGLEESGPDVNEAVVVGGLVFLALLALALRLVRQRRQRLQKLQGLDEPSERGEAGQEPGG